MSHTGSHSAAAGFLASPGTSSVPTPAPLSVPASLLIRRRNPGPSLAPGFPGAVLALLIRRRRGSSPGPATAALDFIEALRTRFLTTASLAGLTDVFNRESHGSQAYPFLVVNLVNESPLTTNGASYPAWAEVQFSVLDDDDGRGFALRDAAYKALAPNLTPPLVFADGTDGGGRIPGMKWEIKQSPSGRGGPSAWCFYFSYRFYLGRTLA